MTGTLRVRSTPYKFGHRPLGRRPLSEPLDRVLLLVVALVGCVVAFLGLFDVATASGSSRKLVGVFLLMLGLLAALGAGSGLKGSLRGGAGAFLGACATFVITLVLSITAFLSSDVSLIVQLAYLASVLVAIFAAYRVWTRGKLRLTDFLPGLKGIAAIVSVGTLVGLIPFLYTSQYAPLVSPANLNIDATLTSNDVPGPMTSLQLAIEIANTGESKVVVLGSLYRVEGATLEGERAEATLSQITDRFRARAPKETGLRSFISDWVRIGYGPVAPVASWVDVGQGTRTNHLLFVRDDVYDVAHVLVAVTVAHGDRVRFDELGSSKRVAKEPGPRAALNAWPVQPLSKFESVTRGSRELISGVMLEFKQKNDQEEWFSPPSLFASIERAGYRLGDDRINGWRTLIERQYGLSTQFARTTTWISDT